MAFTFDTATTSAVTSSTGLTQSHTCAAGADLLVVCLSVRGNVTTAVSYGGQALTLAESHFEPSDPELAEIWYKVAPLTGANNVVVSGITGSLAHAVVISSWLVDSTPAALDVTAQNASAGGANPSVTLAGAVGGLAIDCLTAEEPGTGGATWTPGGDQTQLGEAGNSSWSIAASYELSPIAAEVFNWTVTAGGTTADSWAHVAAVFKEGGGGTDYTGTVPAAGAATATGRTPLVSTMTRPFASTTIA